MLINPTYRIFLETMTVAQLVKRHKGFYLILMYISLFTRGTGSSVSIVTNCGMDGPGPNPGGNEIFRQSRPALGPTQPSVKWVPGLSKG